MNLDIKATDLLKWARYFDQAPTKIKPAIASALNAIGRSVAQEMVQYIADQTDLLPDDIMPLIRMNEATPDHLEVDIDASAIAPPSLDWSRPWDKVETPSFDQATLVNITTMGDELVCPKCEEASEDSPYDLETAQQMLPIHPRCRCLLTPYYSYRKLPVTFARPGAAPPQILTVKQLAKAVRDQLQVALKAT